MNKWAGCCVGIQATIEQAIRTIEESTLQIALVVDGDRLRGTLTDGDVRRALLAGKILQDSVAVAMNPKPTVAFLGEDRDCVISRMRNASIRHMPILDITGALVGMETLDELQIMPSRNNPIILMAGGLGTRLMPLTEECPKPMLTIGGRPILETILVAFIDHGFRNFYICVNHKADVITDHFADGSSWGANIQYIHETKRLGTAGALSLLPSKPSAAMIVMNGDILTKVNFDHLLEFHRIEKSMATMCVREYEHQVPYGVIRLSGRQILDIQEKPLQRFFVNAGIYVLDPDTIDIIPKNEYLDMTSLFELIVRENWATAAFPLREYWIDIGRHPDLDAARSDFQMMFG